MTIDFTVPIGDECVPLPMQPLIVGYDYDWMSVSPLTIPTWVSFNVLISIIHT